MAVAATLLLVTTCAAQTAPEAEPLRPFVRAHVEPADHIVVGQPVRLVVEVLVPNYFLGSPQFPDLEIKNAIVVAPQERAENFSERSGSATFAGIRQSYFLYTEQPGTFHIPHAVVGVKYADAPPHATQTNVPFPDVTFRAELPAAADGMSYFLPTTKLVVQQRWSSPLSDVRTGQTVERTITVTADRLQGMLIPPAPLDAPDGLRAYPGEPVVLDQKNDRGDFLGGKRVDTVKYLIQKPGDYALPPVQLSWWDLSSNRLRTETLPAVHFTATPDPSYTAELPPEVEPAAAPQTMSANPWKPYWHWLRASWYWPLGAIAVIWAFARWLPRIFHSLRIRRDALRESEAAYFRKLIHTCEGNDARSSYAALLRWLNRTDSNQSLDEFIQRSGDAVLRNEIATLGAALYSSAPSSSWNGHRLAQSLREARGRARRKIREASKPLPELNPAGGKSA